MKAFHNDPKIKKFYVDRIKRHMKMDNLVQGFGWVNGKGCAIGCTFENYNDNDIVEKWDVPLVLVKLEDKIFENLPNKEAMKWPLRFTKALKVGVDYSMVWPKFTVKLLERVKKYIQNEQVLKRLDGVISLYDHNIQPDGSKWQGAAADAAYADDSARASAKQLEWKWIANTLIEVIKGEK